MSESQYQSIHQYIEAGEIAAAAIIVSITLYGVDVGWSVSNLALASGVSLAALVIIAGGLKKVLPPAIERLRDWLGSKDSKYW